MSQKSETRAAHSSLVPSPYPLSPITLLTHFDAAARTPADVARLKQLILQLAVRGRLAPQDANDEPAGALLARIAAENLGDRKSGASNTELPSLPEGWCWSRLPEISHISPRNDLDDQMVVSFIPMDLVPTEYGEQVKSESRVWGEIRKGYTHFQEGDVAFAKITPCFQNRKSAVMRGLTNGYGAGTTELVVFRADPRFIVPEYLLLFLKSPAFIQGGIDNMKGTAGQQRVPKEYITSVPFPLPPTAEQHRLVAQVDHLLAQADELAARLAAAEAQRRRAHAAALARLTAPAPAAAPAAWPLLAAHFDPLHATPDALAPLRAAILQLAVMGRLVPQDAKEEPAEGVLERIAREKDGRYRLLQEDKASDPTLPAGWQWVTISEIAEHRLGKMLDAHKNTGKLRPYVRNLNVQWLRFELSDIKQIRIEDNEKEEYALRPGDLLICEGGEPGRCAIWEDAEREMYFQKALHRVRPYKGVEPKYLLYHLWADALVGKLEAHFTGATIKHFTGKALRAYRVALPPSREQVRIVAKIEALLSQIDQLAAHLTAAETTRQRWLAAVVAGAGG